jgi:hypothetical protein
MRLLFRHSLRHWRALAGAFALATIHQLLLLADPQILRMIVDRYVLRISELPRGTAAAANGRRSLLARNGLYARMWREQSEIAEVGAHV